MAGAWQGWISGKVLRLMVTTLETSHELRSELKLSQARKADHSTLAKKNKAEKCKKCNVEKRAAPSPQHRPTGNEQRTLTLAHHFHICNVPSR